MGVLDSQYLHNIEELSDSQQSIHCLSANDRITRLLKRKRQLKEKSQPPWYCLLSEVI